MEIQVPYFVQGTGDYPERTGGWFGGGSVTVGYVKAPRDTTMTTRNEIDLSDIAYLYVKTHEDRENPEDHGGFKILSGGTAVKSCSSNFDGRLDVRDLKGKYKFQVWFIGYKTGNSGEYLYQAVGIKENNPPAKPTTITTDKSKVKIGDTITVTPSPSTDPDGDSITYHYEVQINSGNWVEIGATAQTSITYKVPVGTSTLGFRVRAFDGVEYSQYSTSTMVLVNNPPAKPTTITTDKSNAEIGDTLRITVSPSTDPDGDSITYHYEVQINSRKWMEIEAITQTSCTYKVPIGTSTLRFRVRAFDGIEYSQYSTSTMVLVNNPLPDYMDVVLGHPVRPGGGVPGLKWTVSPQPPATPKAGELWVGADPSQVRIDQVIHLQSSKKEVANPKPNAIYVIIPANGYSFVETPVTVDFFSNKKYRLNAQCPYIFVTGDSGQVLDIVRGVYTGTEWKTWGERPDIPEQWEFLQAIAASTTWTPPKPGQWYRVHVFGKCGDGGKDLKTIRGGSYAEYGYAGGNTGGYACSIILLEDSVPCTINDSVTAFGAYLSATSGGSGTNCPNNSSGNMHGNYAKPSDVVGEGIGGTEHNIKGTKAEAGGVGSGTSSGSHRRYRGGTGGKGARFTLPANGWPYIDATTQFAAGTGSDSTYTGYEQASTTKGNDAVPYPALNLNAPMLYGGGQGAGGVGIYNDTWQYGGKGSIGSPGLIIIEKGKGV